MGFESNLHIFKDSMLKINKINYLINVVSSIKLIHALHHIKMNNFYYKKKSKFIIFRVKIMFELNVLVCVIIFFFINLKLFCTSNHQQEYALQF